MGEGKFKRHKPIGGTTKGRGTKFSKLSRGKQKWGGGGTSTFDLGLVGLKTLEETIYGLHLSPEFFEFSLTCLFHHGHGWKKFSIYGVHIPRKCIESMHFYLCSSPPLKTPGRTFLKFVSLKTKWVEETMIFFIKIQTKNMKMTWNISLFILCVICNFS